MNSTPSYTVPSSASGSLADLAPGMEGRILGFREGCRLRLRLLDLGFVPGTLVKCTGRSPLGDPCAYLVRRTVIAIESGKEMDDKDNRSCRKSQCGEKHAL